MLFTSAAARFMRTCTHSHRQQPSHTHTHTCKQVWASSLARTHTNNHRVAGTGSLLHFCSAYFRALLI